MEIIYIATEGRTQCCRTGEQAIVGGAMAQQADAVAAINLAHRKIALARATKALACQPQPLCDDPRTLPDKYYKPLL